jgi:hypothetical protein
MIINLKDSACLVARFVDACFKLYLMETATKTFLASSKGQLDDRLKRQGAADGNRQGPLRPIYLLGVHSADRSFQMNIK